MTCIDTATTGRSDVVSACQVTKYDGSQGQGSPIVITKIEPEILLQQKYVRPQFKIYIENAGEGYVTNSATCADTYINDVKSSGKVNVRAWLSNKKDENELQCGAVETKGILRLVDSESYIRCYLPPTASGVSVAKRSYVTPLIVEVKYTYVSISEQNVEILHNNALEDNVTKGLCATYQTYSDGKCISTCEYCSNNPTAAECKDNKPYPEFTFTKGFTCSCGLDVCNTKLNKGSCIKGYCAGDLYCCSTNQCDQWQIEYNGKCIDKCEYCAKQDSIGKDAQTCSYGFNFTGFECTAISETTCSQYAQNQSCIQGYCGGTNINKYCANTNKITNANIPAAPIPTTPQTNPVPQGAQETLCHYCANIEGADARCTASASDGSQVKISNEGMTKDFGCFCSLTDKDHMPGADFILDNSLCNGANYCCNSMTVNSK